VRDPARLSRRPVRCPERSRVCAGARPRSPGRLRVRSKRWPDWRTNDLLSSDCSTSTGHGAAASPSPSCSTASAASIVKPPSKTESCASAMRSAGQQQIP
jgi:hypothetical protein